MITINKLKEALGKYVDEEFTMSMGGIQAFGVGAAAGLYIRKIDSYIVAYEKALTDIGILQKDGTLDMDLVYEILSDQFTKKQKLTVTVPIIGEVAFNQADLDKIYNYCK